YDRRGDATVAEFPAQRAAVAVGQADVQDHELVQAVLRADARFRAVGGLDDDVWAFRCEMLGERAAQHRIVVEQKDALGAGHACVVFRSGARNSTPFCFAGVCPNTMKPSARSRENSVVDRVIAAVDAFRRGRPVVVAGTGGHIVARALDTLRGSLPQAYAASVKLAKLAGLLPATVVEAVRPAPKGAVALKAADILAYDEEIVRTLRIVARARVPLEGAEKTELVSFRPMDGGPEHYAIVIGAPPTAKPVLTRLHSECFTGDLLGSLKCDCGTQLRGAIETIARAGGGVLLYLAQEGRGIGLINKLRAYRLQDQGFDTIDANERLGFEADERQYGLAARMLSLLGYRSVRLLTNNPDKVAALKAAGVKVAGRVPHAFPDNEHNRAYLHTKASRAGHFL